MIAVKRIVLDVLKPHQPDALEFSRELAALEAGYRVCLAMVEMDEDTQTLRLEVSGESIALAPIAERIASLGGSIHSIDQVEVVNEGGEL
jgi:hypothetical protein